MNNGRAMTPLCRAAGALLPILFAALASAQKTPSLPTVDPYTGGDPALMAAVGIEAYAPMFWAEKHTTGDIVTELGEQAQICFAETRHFKIGIGLAARPFPIDKDEKKDLLAEFKAIGAKLPKFKPGRRVDSWQLVHLYAQRLEALYADFCKRIGYVDEAPPCVDGKGQDGRGFDARGGLGKGPFLGQHGKFCVLMVEKRGDLARYLRRFAGRDEEEGACHHFLASNSLVLVSTPDIRTGALSTDRAMHCNVVYGMVRNFVTGLGGYTYDVPVWNVEGLAHWYRLRLDTGYNTIAGLPEPQWVLLHDADWQAKARARADTGAFAPAKELLAWDMADMRDFHKHVMVWSRVDFLMSLGDEKYGRYLKMIKGLPVVGQKSKAQILARQAEALAAVYGFDEEGFDRAWVDWVKKNYR